MLTVSYHKWTLLDLSPLSRQLILAQRIFVKIYHAPPGCSEPQALITGKVATPLEMPQLFMMPMRYHRDIFSGTLYSKNYLAYWQRLMVLSRRTCQAHLPRTPFLSGKFSLTESWSALWWCLSHCRRCLTSLLEVGFAMALASACPALHSILASYKGTLYMKYENCGSKLRQAFRILQQWRQQLCFLLLTNVVKKIGVKKEQN